MLDAIEDKINTLAEDYGMDYILEVSDLTAFAAIKALEEAGLVDLDDILALNTNLEDMFGDDT